VTEHTQRRLAAIVSADVVGYSRLMGVDEIGTLDALRNHRTELIDPLITQHGGRIVKTMGDGLLLEFPSVVDATRCAIEIQQGMAERNEEIGKDTRITFRIGINLGDIIIEGEDILGDGVNIAARLQEIAEPGGVAISIRVYEDVRDRLDALFEDAGEQALKNISRPVQVWRWSPAETSASSSQNVVAGATSPVSDKPSIAILPFDNMSGDPEQDYFADGITEDIITELSRFQSIFVIARNSAFTYKGQAVRVQDVGQDLGVRYVVEGSVRKAGERVRVTVQLIDAHSGNHIWAERYDHKLADIFELQDELTQSIVATLPGRVESADIERVKRKPFHDISAYDCILRAKLNHHRGTLEDNAEGLRLLDQVIETDPECASAYAWRACIIAQAGARGYIEYTDELDKELYGYVLKGLSLDENDLECVRILCEFRIEQNRPDDALVLNDRALRINPNDPRIVAQRGEIFTWLGQPEEGVVWVRKAMRLDPYDADAWAHLLGRALFGAHQYREALSAFKRVPIPRYSHHAFMAVCHTYLNDDDLAEVEGAELLSLKQDFSSGEFCKALFYKSDADRQHVREGLVKVGLPE
jgi:adenylate cyclase